MSKMATSIELSTVNIDVLRTGCRNFLSVKDLTQIRVNYTGIAKRTSYEEWFWLQDQIKQLKMNKMSGC